MKLESKIIYKELTDLSRLPEIHSLTYDTFVDGGLILPKEERELDLYPHLNRIRETVIIIAECEGKIIGTNSVTLDSRNGLHTDLYFRKETNQFRRINKRIGSSWRIATDKDHRGSIKIIMNLIKHSLLIGLKMNMEKCLFVFEKKNERVYQKLIGATTIAEKRRSADPNVDYKIHMVLMAADVEEVYDALSRREQKRKTLKMAYA
ncbi:N-acyl amino acid synthase FeeM domain-containing protein [Pseudofulvibacter geojedonensis]|uniref:N-acetyltransferase domain-containing protein n=1 Tax=Pseudofulvibacter geojedonensis TaxID=1123758 RepID=A0ABW3I5N8_9FLAO